MKLNYQGFNLPFTYPFGISRGTKTHQPSLVVSLEHMGHRGWGEAPAITYYDITVEKMIADLEQKKSLVEKFAFTEPDRYWHYLHHLFPQNPFLVCALDMAGWDLYGKMKKKSLGELWGNEPQSKVVTDYTIGIDTIEKMVEKLKDNPWPIYKIKLGTANDIEIVEALRKHTDSVFRIDANSAWETEEALQKIEALSKLGIEFIEQPLAKENWDGMKVLYKKSSLPLIADESCVKESDVDRCKDHFHGVNIKLTKCSGITPALRMITRARELNLKLMFGSMNESTLGSAAIVHLAAKADYLDADGPLLLSQDIATGLKYENGSITPSLEPGLGIKFTGQKVI